MAFLLPVYFGGALIAGYAITYLIPSSTPSDTTDIKIKNICEEIKKFETNRLRKTQTNETKKFKDPLQNELHQAIQAKFAQALGVTPPKPH